MADNQRSKVIAIGIAIQTGPGVFNPPAQADLCAASSVTNDTSAITATDPTATGSIFDGPDVFLGTTATAGGTISMRGFGSGGVPAANAYVPGRVLQAAGWSENVIAAAITNTAQAGPNANSIKLAAAESAVSALYTGAIINHPQLGATAKLQYSTILAYDGVSKNALLGEPIGTTITSGSYTIPAQVYYKLGTLAVAPPLLSVSVWRDRKRYDLVDCVVTSLAINMPVSNEANTVFPDITFAVKGNLYAVADDITPSLPSAVLATPTAPARGGKFYLDRTQLGHQSLKFTEGTTVAAQSNINLDAGQEGYSILGGTRTIDFDINQMAVADFDLITRVNNQVLLPVEQMWGLGQGNRFGFALPNVLLRPFTPGDRNGFVSLTGAAQTTDVTNSATLAIY